MDRESIFKKYGVDKSKSDAILKKYGVKGDTPVQQETPRRAAPTVKDPTKTHFDSPVFDKIETIGPRPPLHQRLLGRAKAEGALATKAILGDVPFLRKTLPQRVQDITPATPAQNITFPVTRFGRDIAAITVAEALTGTLAPAAEGYLLKKGIGTGTAKVASKFLPDFIRGGMFGAVTAGTENLGDIVKKSAATGAFFAAIPIALKGIGKTAQVAWNKMPEKVRTGLTKTMGELGHSIGLAVKQNMKAYDLIKERYQTIAGEKIKSDVFRHNLKKQLTPDEDALLPFLREKALPKGTVLTPAAKAKLTPIAKEVGDYLDDAHKFIVENYGDDIRHVENYVPHIWDIPKNKVKDVASWFVTKDPHLKKRYITTLKAGMEGIKTKSGEVIKLKPKYTKMTDILKVYDDYRIKAAANVKFVKDLKSGFGKQFISRVDKAPADWVKIDHPVLSRAVYRGAVKTAKGKTPVLMKQPVAVHPEIADVVKTALGQGWDMQTNSEMMRQLIRGTAKVNAFGKFANLSASMFHHVALAETAIATGIGGRAAKRFVVDPIIHPIKTWKAIRAGKYGALKNIELTKDAVMNRVQVGAIGDVQRNIIEQSLLNIEKKLSSTKLIGKAIGAPVKGVRKAVEFWNKSLWDYYHTELKLMGYEKLVSDGLRKFPHLPEKAIKQEVGQFVNDTFGGQAWDLLLKSPKWQQSMQNLLLSPDWTLSTLRQAMSPFGVGATSAITRELRKDMGTEFWKRAIVYFWGGMNLLNYGLTKAHTGKGRYMWENTPGQETKLFIGQNPDGTEAYMRWGKQFRELPEFFIHEGRFKPVTAPLKKLGGKVSPILRAGTAQIMPHPVWQKGIHEGEPLARLKELSKFPQPYSVQNIARTGFKSPKDALRFAFPIGRGMTNYKAVKMFKEAIEKEDVGMVQRIREGALRNGLDATSLFKRARSSIKADATYEAKQQANGIYEDLKSQPREQRREYYRSLVKDGVITEKISKQLKKIVEQQSRVDKQKRQLNIR